MRKSLTFFLLCTLALSAFVELAESTTSTFTVSAGEEVTKHLNLAVDDHVLIKFTVVGETKNLLDFWITDPNGSVKVEFKKRGAVDYSFVCDTSGDYVLHFSNKGSAEGKLVTLDYEVEHYIFGMPQMLFLTIIIVLVCMGAVAVFFLSAKPH
ncbi:hypothetical protein DRO59_06165 [Candidatus Bathyarchaeota archaeon]|nr:MAG: hypothetical protein DRO59_06165 [Candidatus Bathyarchaeota archaeon]